MALQYPLISVEEHWLSSRVQDLYQSRGAPDAHDEKGPIGVYMPPLKDFGQGRLESMNSGGIAIQVISHVANSIAVDAKTCAMVNDELHSLAQKNPTRYATFAMLPMSNPQAASEELRRCVKSLGFVGAMIDSNCEGKFYDDDWYWEVFEAAAELHVPIYLHPAPNDDATAMYSGNYSDGVATTLSQYAWGWHSETGLHFLRLYAAGLFDRFKELKIVLGHCGEMLPFMLDRVQGLTDRAWPQIGCRRERSLRQVWDESVWVSISGMFTIAPMLTVLEQCKPDRILYSVDHPFGHNNKGPEFLLKLKERGLLDDEKLHKIAYTNAQNLLKITVSPDWEEKK